MSVSTTEKFSALLTLVRNIVVSDSISIYKSYDELPVMLNEEIVKNVLGISLTSAYELMHEKDFPSIKVGSRIVVPKDKFREWVEKRSSK